LDLNKKYLINGQLGVTLLGRGFAWLDAGTHESVYQAAEIVKITQVRQGFKLACLEEIAYYMGYISRDQQYNTRKAMEKNDYGSYLLEIASRKHAEQYWDPIR